VVEDALSRVPDASDWGMAPGVISQITEEFGRPSINLFASDTWHVAPAFVSLRFMPGCTAVDARSRDWRDLVLPSEMAWIFPPVRAVSQAIQKLRQFRTDAILIVPQAPATNWWLELRNLKASARILWPMTLDRSTDICIPSRRVPKGTINLALFKSGVFKVSWLS
jgi:hypothetical protein